MDLSLVVGPFFVQAFHSFCDVFLLISEVGGVADGEREFASSDMREPRWLSVEFSGRVTSRRRACIFYTHRHTHTHSVVLYIDSNDTIWRLDHSTHRSCQPCFHFSLSRSFTCVTSIDAAPFGKICQSGKKIKIKKEMIDEELNINGLFCRMIALTFAMLLCSLC